MPTPPTKPSRNARRRFGGWRELGWLACGVVAGALITWLIVLSPGDVASKGLWFFGAGAFAAVAVAMWQTVNVQRQAKELVADAAAQLRRELAAAQERFTRQLAASEERAVRELALTQSLHQAELEAQRELARVERAHHLAQQQKDATVNVSRAVGVHARMLATLWNQGASILRIDDRDAREEAMNSVFEQIGQVVNDFSAEFTNAQLMVDDDRLHEALNSVNDAVLMAIRVAEDMHIAVIEGRPPDRNAIRNAQRLMYERAAGARHLAWDLLRISLDDNN